ncbi:hypothetical protein [Paenibacillus dauci]|nr:hypothetical protein [Paenibacillus dauci]
MKKDNDQISWKLFRYWLKIPRVLRMSIIPLVMLIISILGWIKIFRYGW